MLDLKGYQLQVWQPIYHNGKFSHHGVRFEIFHAHSEAEARQAVQLAKGYVRNIHPGMCITVEDEYIYSVKYLGRVTYRTIVEYKKEE